MKNKKGIIIIYLEGDSRSPCKQEKYFFESSPSKRIWDFSLRELGYKENTIYRSMKIINSTSNLDSIIQILDKRIKNILKNNNSVLILITGDHDELSNIRTLEKTEYIANNMKEQYIKSDNIECQIILERDKKFKIETLMSEFTNCSINKKILREKTGTEYPDLIELFKAFHNIDDESKIKELFYKKIIQSKHKLLTAIKENSPSHTKK